MKSIEHRLDDRFNNGMIEEVESLIENGLGFDRLKYFGLEYKIIGEYLFNIIDVSLFTLPDLITPKIEMIYTLFCILILLLFEWMNREKKYGKKLDHERKKLRNLRKRGRNWLLAGQADGYVMITCRSFVYSKGFF